MSYRPKLEAYSGGRGRYTCPGCGTRKEFTRYLKEDGTYYDDSVGICNRRESCGYHYPPRQFFLDNPQLTTRKGELSQSRKPKKKENLNKVKHEKHEKHEWSKPTVFQPEYIDSEVLVKSLGDYDQNTFVTFLSNLFADNLEAVEQAVRSYFIGTFEGKTVFWQIDCDRRIRTGELMLFDIETGKRQKQHYIDKNGQPDCIPKNWIHDRLKYLGKVPKDFKLQQCYFGEHLIKDPSQIVAIVEAAKTAVICSIVFPEYTWIAAGALGYVSAEKLFRYKENKIILFPDGNKTAFDYWQKAAVKAQKKGVRVAVSTLIENFATTEQKQKGLDLADYFIAEQKQKLEILKTTLGKNQIPQSLIKPKKHQISILDALELSLRQTESGLLSQYQKLYQQGITLLFDDELLQVESVLPMDAETHDFISQNRRSLACLAQRSALQTQWFNNDDFAAQTYRMEVRERTAIILESGNISGLQAIKRASQDVTKDWYVLHQQLKNIEV